MRWFKCPSLSSPVVIEAETVLGGNGAFSCLKVVQEAHAQEIYDLDAAVVAKWAGVKMDRAQKILPFVKKILQESLEISSKSQKILGKSPKISSNAEDFDPSNPRGCNKSIERIEKKEEKEKEKSKKEKISETPECPPLRGGQDPDFKKDKAPALPARGTRLNPDWVPKAETIELMRKERPDLNYERTLSSFRDYWIAKPGKDGVKLDWEATFRNWVRNERAAPMHSNPMPGGFAGAGAYNKPRASPEPLFKLAPIPEYDPDFQYEVIYDASNG